jgi:NADPH:quinone reductase-like Zn-dependent oxidoreductase
LDALDAAMLVVCFDPAILGIQSIFARHRKRLTLADECEGCRVHNLHCVEGTGKLHGFTTHGHFAEYSLSDYRNSMVLPAGMDLETAAPLFCAGVTG